MFKLLKGMLWYLFFAVYWTAQESGYTNKPYENARYYFILSVALNLFAIFELLLYYGYSLNPYLVVFLCTLFSLLFVNAIFLKKNVYMSKLSQFHYLSQEKYRIRRYVTLGFVALWTMAFVAFGGVIRMK